MMSKVVVLVDDFDMQQELYSVRELPQHSPMFIQFSDYPCLTWMSGHFLRLTYAGDDIIETKHYSTYTVNLGLVLRITEHYYKISFPLVPSKHHMRLSPELFVGQPPVSKHCPVLVYQTSQDEVFYAEVYLVPRVNVKPTIEENCPEFICERRQPLKDCWKASELSQYFAASRRVSTLEYALLSAGVEHCARRNTSLKYIKQLLNTETEPYFRSVLKAIYSRKKTSPFSLMRDIQSLLVNGSLTNNYSCLSSPDYVKTCFKLALAEYTLDDGVLNESRHGFEQSVCTAFVLRDRSGLYLLYSHDQMHMDRYSLNTHEFLQVGPPLSSYGHHLNFLHESLDIAGRLVQRAREKAADEPRSLCQETKQKLVAAVSECGLSGGDVLSENALKHVLRKVSKLIEEFPEQCYHCGENGLMLKCGHLCCASNMMSHVTNAINQNDLARVLQCPTCKGPTSYSDILKCIGTYEPTKFLEILHRLANPE